MTFNDYFLCEASIGELVSKYATLNQHEIEAWSHKMYDYCTDWALISSIENPKRVKQFEKSIKILFKEVAKYRPFAIQALRDLHELEYKQSQLKKFYSKPEVLAQLDLTLLRLAKWLKEYLSVVLYSRACGDGLDCDNNPDGIKPDMATVINNFGHIARGYDIYGKNKLYDNYITPIFVELYNARSLPQILIAISKAKNAEHDGGKIMTEWGTGLFCGNEKAFDEISNLNYRKLDRELQQELS